MKFLIMTCNIFLSQLAWAQNIEIKGKVIDAKSGLPLNGVTVSVENITTITNINGYFSLLITNGLVRQANIITSYIGYKQSLTPLLTNKFFIIEMGIKPNTLDEVIVTGNANRIIRKAIAKIPDNYPATMHIMEGVLRFYRTELDSPKVYRFFKSDAVLSVLFPAYTDYEKASGVRVIQNKTIYLKPDELPTDSVQWLGGYRIDNFIHQRAAFVDINKINDYSYHVLGKTILQQRKVWIIGFESKKRKHISGTLFIDTLSYAFVAAQYSRFNIPMHINVLKKRIYKAIDEISFDIVFQNIGDKWYLYKKSLESTYSSLGTIKSNAYSDFFCTKIDTTIQELLSINKREFVKDDQKDNELIKSAPDSNWATYDKLFATLEGEQSIRHLPVPVVDKHQNLASSYDVEKIPFYKRKTFLENTIIRSTISVNSFNLRSTAYSRGRFGGAVGMGIRVYKNTYINLAAGLNFGDSSKIISSKSALFLTHSFNLIDLRHPLYFSPSVGISIAELGRKKEHFITLYSVITGITISCPVIAKLAPFFSVTYDTKVKDHGQLKTYFFNPVNFAFGFYYSFK